MKVQFEDPQTARWYHITTDGDDTAAVYSCPHCDEGPDHPTAWTVIVTGGHLYIRCVRCGKTFRMRTATELGIAALRHPALPH